ncbi:Ubiquinone/menaquinone biosynthesis C-methyltransferase UbiE [Babesia sp. Xinjiang]|uniref:Ubiquinone/menaquinone biosynthesis C-methyltransferase UbiE n=1 Tax=Babesia sp. Xinjiang TaxID=462227 RepID=UPI000A237D6C|nr:Ubiquinone/menaquinone biosynthesis C-methyltransferase UbiE [Babesia sp. Xinjiang]ORM41324.1 Ubiquinone/menaquinone biosynthesis C-methyltransferase UbiE [Babesia sp. Xinjiang]
MSLKEVFTFRRVCASVIAVNGIYMYAQYRRLVLWRPEYKDAGRPEEKHRIAIFDNIAPTYDLTHNITHAKLGITAAKANMLERAKGHVLDVAAGTLENYRLYRGISSLTAVDKSVMMCLEMKRKIEAAKPDYPVTIVCADASNLPFNDESFNTVVTTHGLCSVENPEACLHEIARVMRPRARYFALERGRVYYSSLRRLLEWLKLYPNPAIPWKYGYFEDRDPLALLTGCSSLVVTDFAVFGYGMNYSIVARRAYSEKVSEFTNEPRLHIDAKIIYQYTPKND